jgi:hypothetical protein
MMLLPHVHLSSSTFDLSSSPPPSAPPTLSLHSCPAYARRTVLLHRPLAAPLLSSSSFTYPHLVLALSPSSPADLRSSPSDMVMATVKKGKPDLRKKGELPFQLSSVLWGCWDDDGEVGGDDGL